MKRLPVILLFILSVATILHARIIIWSVDALGPYILEDLKQQPAWNDLIGENPPSTLLPVNSTLTAPNHTAFLTGFGPEITGVIMNSLPYPNEDGRVSAFRHQIPAPPLWQLARRMNRTTLSVAFPQQESYPQKYRADRYVLFPYQARSKSRIVRSDEIYPAVGWVIPDRDRTWLALQYEDYRIALAVSDGRLLVGQGNRVIATLVSGEWIQVELKGNQAITVWMKLLGLDPGTGHFELYVDYSSPLKAFPKTFQDKLQSTVPVWMTGCEPEETDLAFETSLFFYDQWHRLNLEVLKTDDADILFLHMPLLDHTLHFHPWKRKQEILPVLNRYLKDILSEKKEDDVLYIFGDHGMVPLQSMFFIRAFLKEKDYGNFADPVSSGGTIMLTAKPSLPSAEWDRVRPGLKKDLAGLVQVDRVEDGVNRYQRDLVVYLKPGYMASCRPSKVLTSPSEGFGQHGYHNRLSDMQALAFRLGPGEPLPPGLDMINLSRRVLEDIRNYPSGGDTASEKID